jgi:hypothetical protein
MAAIPPPVIPAIPVFTVADAMESCGVPLLPLYGGDTPAARVAFDLFDDNFASCMDKSFDEIDRDFSIYSKLTAAQGQIRAPPGVTKRIKAFVQWTQDELRMGRNPSGAAFPVVRVAELTRRHTTHKKFVEDSGNVANAARPKDFDTNTKFQDWEPTLIGFLRLKAGRDGIPLAYVLRDSDASDPSPKGNFLEEYISAAPLAGEAYEIDKRTVAVIIRGLTNGNHDVEVLIQSMADPNDGREMHKRIKGHYQGTGAFASELSEAEKILDTLHYSGEKKPYMWWDEFERQINWAYSIYQKTQGNVHTQEMKLLHLQKKLKADFLQSHKTAVEIEMSKIPMTQTFTNAMLIYRNAVNQKFPPGSHNHTRGARRTINEVSSQGRGGGRNQGRGGRGRGGYGRGGRGGRGRGGGRGGNRDNVTVETVTLTDGSEIQYHPKYRFPQHVLDKFPQALHDKRNRQREAYRRSLQGGSNTGSQVQNLESLRQSIIQEVRSAMSQGPEPPAQISTDQRSQVSQVTTGTHGTTMMGGRNDQASRSGRHGNNNNGGGER